MQMQQIHHCIVNASNRDGINIMKRKEMRYNKNAENELKHCEREKKKDHENTKNAFLCHEIEENKLKKLN